MVTYPLKKKKKKKKLAHYKALYDEKGGLDDKKKIIKMIGKFSQHLLHGMNNALPFMLKGFLLPELGNFQGHLG